MQLRPEDSFGYVVNYLARLFARALHQRIAPLGVVPGQFPALLMLFQDEGLTQAELLHRVQVEQATLANTLKRMERDGLITRIPDPTDGRRSLIFLTDKAKDLKTGLLSAAKEVNALAVSHLSPAQRESLLPTLLTMARVLESDVEAG